MRNQPPPDANVTALADPRGVWHSDVSPPAPWYPTLPPAPFPPVPGVPPFPLFLYAKLQAVPRCSPFCDTRAPPPSLPKGDRAWALRAAEAARTQWAQMVDLAQIQVGGSHGTSGEMWQYGAAEAVTESEAAASATAGAGASEELRRSRRLRRRRRDAVRK